MMACSASHSRVADSTSVSQHGIQVEGRAADHLEHVGGRGLLLQRFAQLVEQARILDRDDGLGGEVREQLDLLVGEWPHLAPMHAYRANQFTILEHWHDQDGAHSALLDCCDNEGITLQVALVFRKVRHMDDLLWSTSAGRSASAALA